MTSRFTASEVKLRSDLLMIVTIKTDRMRESKLINGRGWSIERSIDMPMPLRDTILKTENILSL
jgi:hypothetical protein